MKYLSLLFVIIIFSAAHARSIECVVSDNGIVEISMQIPHPEHALIERPNGETVWLQSDPEYIHHQVKDFANLGEWELGPSSKGTVYVNGKPTVQNIFNGKGRYHLYIARNLETEKDNTYFIECYFEIR